MERYRAAVYRLYYGEDFIVDSIQSVRPFVDRVFVFYTKVSFGDVTTVQDIEVVYGEPGETIDVPDPIDYAHGKVMRLAAEDPGIHVRRFDARNNINQFTTMINSKVIPWFGVPELVIIPEPDHVWIADDLEDAILESEKHRASTSRQVEHWRTPAYAIPERKRMGTAFWWLGGDPMPPTGRQADTSKMPILSRAVHNFGFCMTPRNMYWKHLLSIGFSPIIGDSTPDPRWYRRWRDWRPDDRNLEIAKGYGHLIPKAIPYDGPLPESIATRMDAGEWGAVHASI